MSKRKISKGSYPATMAERRDGNPGLADRAFGPAAAEFGEEIRPLGREVGRVTSQAVRALLRSASGLVWGYEKVEDWIAEVVGPKVAGIPKSKRIEPKLMIAGPTIDAMKYCGAEPHLREMFANLLATSMDERTASSAHPAFVEIIKQISPDEAQMINLLAKGFTFQRALIWVYRRWDAAEGTRDDYVMGPYSTLGTQANCKHLLLVPSYITNLRRLQIVNLHYAELHKAQVEELLDDPVILRARKKIERDHVSGRFNDRLHFETGYMEVTPLGEQFFDACVRRQ